MWNVAIQGCRFRRILPLEAGGTGPAFDVVLGLFSNEDKSLTAGNASISFFRSLSTSIFLRDLSGSMTTIFPSDDQQLLTPKCLRAAMNTSCRDFVRNSEITMPVSLRAVLVSHVRRRWSRSRNRTSTGRAFVVDDPKRWHDCKSEEEHHGTGGSFCA